MQIHSASTRLIIQSPLLMPFWPHNFLWNVHCINSKNFWHRCIGGCSHLCTDLDHQLWKRWLGFWWQIIIISWCSLISDWAWLCSMGDSEYGQMLLMYKLFWCSYLVNVNKSICKWWSPQMKTSPQAKRQKLSLLFTSLTISSTLDFITK